MKNEETTAIPAAASTEEPGMEIPDYAIRRFAKFLLVKMQEAEKPGEEKPE